MTKPKIIQHLKEMLRISNQAEDEFFEECKKNYPDADWSCQDGYAYPLKLGIITAKIESILMYLEVDVKEEEKYGRQADDLRQAVGDAEANEDRNGADRP